jgi:hypothetical protein
MCNRISSKFGYLKIVILLFLIFCTQYQIFAQKFYVKASTKEVPQNFTFDITYTVENADVEDFKAPKFDFFDTYGPSQSQNISVINGRVSKSYSFTYTLQPKKQGTFIIPEAKAIINGKQMATEKITIKVIEPQKKQQQQKQQQAYDPFEEFFGGSGRKQKQKSEEEIKKEINENIFVRVIPSKSSLYEGDQFTISYKLYFRIQYQGLNAVKTPSYNGFLMEEFDLPEVDPNKEPEIETYNGKKYYTQEFRRVALFPQKSGKLEITPMEFSCVVGIEMPHPYNPFFTTIEPYDFNFKSNTVSVDVLSLPMPKPKNFSGAVGQFNFQASYDKTTVKVGEPIKLKVSYTGSGNLKLISAPKLEFPEEFEAYEPKLNENYASNGNVVSGTKSFEYVLIPQDGGKFTLPEYEFGYFDLDKKRYVTFKLPETVIDVNGKAKTSVNLLNFNKREKANIDKQKLKSNFTSLYQHRNFYNTSLFWSLSIAPLCLLFVGFLFRKKSYDELTLLAIRKKKANGVALKRMKVAKKLMQQNKEKEFYDEVIRALWQYISDKLHIPISDLSKENISIKLSEKNIDSTQIQQLNHTLEDCEMALFASINKTEAMKKTYENAVNWISNIDENI